VLWACDGCAVLNAGLVGSTPFKLIATIACGWRRGRRYAGLDDVLRWPLKTGGEPGALYDDAAPADVAPRSPAHHPAAKSARFSPDSTTHALAFCYPLVSHGHVNAELLPVASQSFLACGITGLANAA
jgi:hypothetical protein